jgi:hypothetical protein
VDNLSGFQFQDKKDVEGNKTESSNRKEVAGEERIPVSAEETFPGKVWLKVAGLAKAVKDFGDGFVGYG